MVVLQANLESDSHFEGLDFADDLVRVAPLDRGLCKPLRALRGAPGRAGLADRVGIAIPVADSAADSAADLAPDLAADLAVHAETRLTALTAPRL